MRLAADERAKAVDKKLAEMEAQMQRQNRAFGFRVAAAVERKSDDITEKGAVADTSKPTGIWASVVPIAKPLMTYKYVPPRLRNNS